MTKKFLISLILFLIWLATIFVLSGIQNPYLDIEIAHLTVSSFFKHFVEYGILGVLSYNFFRLAFKNQNLAVICSIFFPFLYGVSDEIHQYFVPTRISDLPDVIVDAIGGLAGVLFLILVFFLIRKNNERKMVDRLKL